MEHINIFQKFIKQRQQRKLLKSFTLDSSENFLAKLGGKRRSKPSSETTYYTCRKILSESIGKLSCKLLISTPDGGTTEAKNHNLYDVIRFRPNPYMTATTFWSALEAQCQHHGNSYAYIERTKQNRIQLWIMDSTQVEVWYDNARAINEIPDIYYLWRTGQTEYTLTSKEVLHIKTSDTIDGVMGKSVLQQLRETFDGALESQHMLNNLYKSGMTAKAVLSYTGDLSKEKRDQFVAGIEQYARGELKENGIENIIPLPIGTTLAPLNIKLTDSQFLELRQYTAIQIASAFGCKPYQIGDYEKTSYASQEASQLSFFLDTLLYRLKGFEEELSYKLLTEKERAKGMRIKFNEKAALRADTQTQANILTAYVAAGLMSHNEARAELDLPSKPYGNDLMVSNGAAIPLSMIGAQYVETLIQNTKEPDKM